MMAAQISVICAGYAAVVSRGTHPAPEGEASPGCHSGRAPRGARGRSNGIWASHFSDIRPNRQFFQWPDFPPTQGGAVGWSCSVRPLLAPGALLRGL